MAQNAKTVKRRIKSIANTKKITKAMELVAASKMRKATQSVVATRPFSELSWQTIKAVSAHTSEVNNQLLKTNQNAEKNLFVLITSDRGLAGGFNTNMLRESQNAINELEKEKPVDIIGIGRRGADALVRQKKNVIARFEDMTNKPTFKEILPIASMVIEAYKKGEYSRVFVGYTDFISSITQKPQILELLPLKNSDPNLGNFHGIKEDEENTKQEFEYIFEPNPSEVLNIVLPRLVETMIYQALLESAASEHSARMMAMRNATESANDMLKELTFTYNRIRQTTITQEIAEISSGKAAIK